MAIACITGASSGIGMDLAKQLSKMGYELILISRNSSALHELSSNLKTKCHIIVCDLSSEKACIELADRLAKYPIKILVNSAGFGDFGKFEQTDLDKDLKMIDVNIKALHILTKRMLTEFMKRDTGYILNVASSAGLMPGGPYMATYYATKAYITSLTSAIYQELSEKGSHVHVSMLCPGPVNTNFNKVAGVTFALPGISSSYCARYALKQMFAGKLTIVPSLTMKAAVLGSRLFPRNIALAITAHQQHKKQ